MNNRVLITVCTLKRNVGKVKDAIVSTLEAENNDSEPVVDSRDYNAIKDAIQNGTAQVFVTSGDPDTKLVLDHIKDACRGQNAFCVIEGRYHTSNDTHVEDFIESIANIILANSVPNVIDGIPKASAASIFFNNSSDVERRKFPDESRMAESALNCAEELWG